MEWNLNSTMAPYQTYQTYKNRSKNHKNRHQTSNPLTSFSILSHHPTKIIQQKGFFQYPSPPFFHCIPLPLWENPRPCRGSAFVAGGRCHGRGWGSLWDDALGLGRLRRWGPKIHWIGLLGKILTGNPWVFTIKLNGLSCKFSHNPILWQIRGKRWGRNSHETKWWM